MTEFKGTPGTWHRNIPPATKYTTVWAGRNTHVAHVVSAGLSAEEVEANINLLAAAPELLSELSGILEAYSAYFPPGNPWGDRARAVVAKALGK